MRKYETYKDSGIEWIGEIPSHWEVLNLRKRPFNFEVGKREQTDLKEVVSIGGEHIQEERFFLENLKYVSLEFFETAKNGKIRKDDILLVKDGATIGKAMFVDRLPFEKMMLNEHVYKIEANKFFYYIIQSPETQYQFWMNNQSSAQESITSDTLKSFVFCWPNEKEQTAIAAYLDRKTAEIDELIADKKRLLELYEEEKTAIINQAVTKGINPDAPMKDSGIEWLGEIPEHWEVKRLKMVVSKIGSGVTPSGGSTVYLTSGIPLLRSQNIHFGGLRLDDVAFISDEIDEGMSNSRIQDGDVLLNITGASIGRCYYVPHGFGKGNVNQHVCIIRPISEKIDTIFLYYILRSEIGQTQIRLQQIGANREGLNFEQLKNFGFPIPESIQEQQSIVHYIETECALIDSKTEKTKKLIDLLTEYRTALISEVVTGKIKVTEGNGKI
jgi:type I restriction enzyme S subunit